MAAAAPNTGAPTRAPENIDQLFTPSRRAMFGFVAGAAALATVPAGAAFAHPARAWDVARARFEAARDAAEHYHAAEYHPLMAKIDAEAGSCPSMSYFIPAKVGKGHELWVQPNTDYPPFPAYDRARQIQRAFHEWRARQIAAEQTTEWETVSGRMDSLWLAEDRLRVAMMQEPAPDAAALALKIMISFENDDVWENERAALIADANRLNETVAQSRSRA